jgi:hypothetical protein
MRELYTRHTFLEPLDPFLPKWVQIDKKQIVYAAYVCSHCGHIVEESPMDHICLACAEYADFSEVEVDEDLNPIEWSDDE